MSEDVERANVVPSLVLEQWDAVSDHVKRAALEIAITRSPAWRDDMSEAPRNKDLYLWSRKHGLVVGYFAPGMDHYRKPTAIYKGAHIEFQPTYWQLPLPPEEKA